MKPLLDLEACLSAADEYQAALFKKTPWVMGLFFGVALGLMLPVGLWAHHTAGFAVLRPMQFGISIPISLAGGVIGGFVWSARFKRRMRAITLQATKQVFFRASEARDSEFDSFVPCSWRNAPGAQLGGMLVIGNDHLEFRGAQGVGAQEAVPLVLTYDRISSTDVVRRPFDRLLQRLLFSGEMATLDIQAEGATYNLWVPDPEIVQEFLRQVIAARLSRD